MSLKPIADKAVVQICNTIAAQLSDDERASISRIVEQVVIDTGSQDGERLEVMGLAVGDVIVHRGHAGLVEGAKVRIRGGGSESAVAEQGTRSGEGT